MIYDIKKKSLIKNTEIRTFSLLNQRNGTDIIQSCNVWIIAFCFTKRMQHYEIDFSLERKGLIVEIVYKKSFFRLSSYIQVDGQNTISSLIGRLKFKCSFWKFL